MTVQEWLSADNQVGIDIWDKKYRYNAESFDEWLKRVSNNDEKVERIIKERKFLFGGRTLSNRGTGKPSSYSNCYSSGYCEDSVEGIMNLAKNLALTYKAEGGQGLSLSKIRPKGSPIGNSGFKSDGIVPFMEIFNTVTASVMQGGSRKGALMMSLDASHQEILEFIKIKSDPNKINKANLSVEIDDEFMEAVEEYYLSGREIEIYCNREYGGHPVRYKITPIKIYKEIMYQAWNNAEPGVIFTDRFRGYNLMQFDKDYEIVTGNPCGEQPLPKNGACNLGSINLSEFVLEPFTENARFDTIEFMEAVNVAVRALDNVLDEGMNLHALKEQRDMAKNYRNIGLGIMGLGDMFIKLGQVYGSEESQKTFEEIMCNMFRISVTVSSLIAKEKGSYPKYSPVVFNSDIIKNHFTAEEIEQLKENGLRNCSLLSIAPSGSIGTMLNVTTGIEPAFMFSYTRKTESLHAEEKEYEVFMKIAQDYKKIHGGENILPEYFISANEIEWKNRVKIQGIAQKYVDTAISSTVNLRNEATLEEVETLYLYAWKIGLKGITIFRDGCNRSQILFSSEKKNPIKEEDLLSDLKRGGLKDVASDTNYYKKPLNIGCGRLKLFIGYSPKEKAIQDLYVVKAGNGGCEKNIQAVAIFMSGILRMGGNLFILEKAISGISGCTSFSNARATGRNVSKGGTCSSAILNILKDFEKEMEIIDAQKSDSVEIENEILACPTVINSCPDCGAELQFTGGCISCVCGYSKCE